MNKQTLLKWRGLLKDSKRRREKVDKILTKILLKKEYIINKKSSHTIAEEYNISREAVRNRLKRYNIEIRKQGKFKPEKVNISKKLLYNLYWNRGLTSYEIAKKFMCHNTTVLSKLIKYTIPIRTYAEAHHIKPNSKEKLLSFILQELLPNEYKYNKTVIITGLIPDFINKKKKKIIELYGCYWHKCSKCGFGKGRKIDKNRVGIYDLFANFKTLIIWEHELKDLNKLKTKILKFNNKE